MTEALLTLTPTCPECGSSRTVRAGLRETSQAVQLQRFKCKTCHKRFSDANPYKLTRTNSPRQIGDVILGTSKNLDIPTETKTVGVHGENFSLLQFAWLMKKRQLSDATIKLRVDTLTRVQRKGGDLRNPESIETLLATEPYTKVQKLQIVNCYRAYCRLFHIAWDAPRIKYEPRQPFVPLEEELDLIIHAAGKRTATFLQVLKETGARCGEVCHLRYVDIDTKRNIIAINDAEKNSRNRTIKVTPKTIAMLQALKPKYGEYVFNPDPDTIRRGFTTLRDKLAQIHQTPRFKQIHLHTFRHFYACKLYFETKDIETVKVKLGHKSVLNTDRYTHLVEWTKPDNWLVKRPLTTQEEDQLIEAGFEYVRYDDKNQCPIYRKRK